MVYDAKNAEELFLGVFQSILNIWLRGRNFCREQIVRVVSICRSLIKGAGFTGTLRQNQAVRQVYFSSFTSNLKLHFKAIRFLLFRRDLNFGIEEYFKGKRVCPKRSPISMC